MFKKFVNQPFFLIYISFIVLSLLLLIPSIVRHEFVWSNFFCDVGINTFSACVVSVLVEYRIFVRKEKEVLNNKRIYFQDIFNLMTNEINRLLWLDAAFEDADFNWRMDLGKYKELGFLIMYQDKYKEGKLSFAEVEQTMLRLRNKYEINNVKNLDIEKRNKLSKLFLILTSNAVDLLKSVSELQTNRIEVNKEYDFNLEKTEQLVHNISLYCAITSSKNKNYGLAILLLWESIKIIKEFCDFNVEFSATYSLMLSSTNI